MKCSGVGTAHLGNRELLCASEHRVQESHAPRDLPLDLPHAGLAVKKAGAAPADADMFSVPLVEDLGAERVARVTATLRAQVHRSMRWGRVVEHNQLMQSRQLASAELQGVASSSRGGVPRAV